MGHAMERNATRLTSGLTPREFFRVCLACAITVQFEWPEEYDYKDVDFGLTSDVITFYSLTAIDPSSDSTL